MRRLLVHAGIAVVLSSAAIYAKDEIFRWPNSQANAFEHSRPNAAPSVPSYATLPIPAAEPPRSQGLTAAAPECTTDTECAALCPDDCCSLPPDHPDYCDGGPQPEPSWPPVPTPAWR